MTKSLAQRPLYIADWGKLFWHVLNTTNGVVTKLTSEQFLTLSWLPEGAFLVCELAHLGAVRTKFSLAQVYTGQELLSLYAAIEAKDCVLRLFPQGLTPTARKMAGFDEKSDENDLYAIAHYLKACPRLSLRKPPKTFKVERRVEAGWTFKKENDGILNVARRYDYALDKDYVSSFIDAHIDELALRLSDNAKKWMLLSDKHRLQSGKGWLQASTEKRIKRLYTLTALFLHPEGYARKRPDTNALPGINWLKRYALHFSPFHFRGGIARSNLMFHALKNDFKAELGTKGVHIGDFTEEQRSSYCALRQDAMRGITETMQTIRDLVQEKLDNGELALR